ncbi:putative sterigmatocystin 8-o-methyltransferase protein [Rosellinia necatrix]|uniref:Putative sterigmatocystin 8-o-methyltransferase protein n=1 Tax=Rosellinia necatrix TaxID=77044 RepID=A0A1W2TU07_ROSNE|nr:putative sterigmatocystin 8-o-methyltransferase protein [Rosellinia necatrix]
MSSDATEYEALAQQIESILQQPGGAIEQIRDERTRRRLAEGGRKLAAALELPRQTYRRIQYSHLQLPLAVVGVETGLFSALASEDRPFGSAELAERTGVDTGLLKRLLRYYQATDMISQTADDGYQASNVTDVLSKDGHANSLRWTHKITSQGSLNLPAWLQSIQYRYPVGILPTAWTSAVPTEMDPYAWLADNPWALKLAQAHMMVQRDGRPSFFDALDFEKRFAQDTTSSTILFVDVGGGSGSQSLAFRQRYPNLPGRVLLQDRPEVVRQVKPMLADSGNIESEVYDFSTTPQPVQGAIAYYMRNIFHAWGDAICAEILLNIKAGMTQESVLIIDEIAFPERNAKGQAAQYDMEVMICVGGVERTLGQWESLLKSVGLIVHEVVKYDKDYEDAVIIAGLN